MASQKKWRKHIKTCGAKVYATIKKWPWKIIALFVITLVFFSFTLVITYDGGHYLNYVAILEHELPTETWDIVRGPVFPVMIYVFDMIFGKSATGMLVGMFVVYLIFILACYKLVTELCASLKIRGEKIIMAVILWFTIMNPIVFGYFHVVLTEYVAITLAAVNCLVAYFWSVCDAKNTKKMIWFLVYFVLETIFGFHLKQPFVVLSFVPMIVAAIIGICRNVSLKNVLFRAGTVLMAMIMLFLSIVIWNKIVDGMGANKESGRDSASLMNSQILGSAQIFVDDDGDGVMNNNISTLQSVGILLGKFFENPGKILKVYSMNYCGLIGLCKITTEDGVGFSPTDELVFWNLYETVFIAYQVYRESEDISTMPSAQLERAERYSSYSSMKSKIKIFFIKMEKITNILYKICMLMALPCFVVICFVRKKDTKRLHDRQFILCTIMLATTFCYLIFGAVLGLIIDRYSAPVFIPAFLGMVGTVCYAVAVCRQRQHMV